jgi:hypothetical protein
MKKIFTVFLLAAIYFAPFSVRAESTPPSAPLNLTYTDLGDLTVTLSWDPPASEGDAPVTEYNIYYVERVYGDMYVTDGPVTTFTTGKLKAGTSYDFWVLAVNAFGEGDSSERIKVTATEDVTAPVITKGPEVLSITDKTAEVQWETDEPSSSYINFDVHGENPHSSINLKALTLEHKISLGGLIPCTKYFYRVGGVDDYSNKLSSDILSFNTGGCLGRVLDEGESDLTLPENSLSAIFDRIGVEISLLSESFELESIFQIKKLDIAEVDANVGCPPKNKPIGGRVYDIKLLEDFNRDAVLKKPATVTMSYNHEEIAGLDESSISMFHYTEENGWSKLNSCVLDKDANTITCETESFSKFMISAEEDCGYFANNLLFGSYHPDVLNLNKFLSQKGFLNYENKNSNSAADFFGAKTLKAIRSFQKSEGIKGPELTFGILGPKTRAVINQ